MFFIQCLEEILITTTVTNSQSPSMSVESSFDLDEWTFAFIHKRTLSGVGFSITSPYTCFCQDFWVSCIETLVQLYKKKLFSTCERKEKLWRTKPSPSSSSSDIISGVMCCCRLSFTDFFFKTLACLSNSYSDMIKECCSQSGF